MHRALLPAALAILTVASPAFAQDWRVVGMEPGTAVLFDNNSITHNSGDIQSIKMLLIYAEARGSDEEPGYATAANVGIITYNCKLGLSKINPLASYDDAGKIILGEYPEDPTEGWEQAEEGSAIFHVMRYACSGEKPDEHRFGPEIPLKRIRELMAANGF